MGCAVTGTIFSAPEGAQLFGPCAVGGPCPLIWGLGFTHSQSTSAALHIYQDHSTLQQSCCVPRGSILFNNSQRFPILNIRSPCLCSERGWQSGGRGAGGGAEGEHHADEAGPAPCAVPSPRSIRWISLSRDKANTMVFGWDRMERPSISAFLGQAREVLLGPFM